MTVMLRLCLVPSLLLVSVPSWSEARKKPAIGDPELLKGKFSQAGQQKLNSSAPDLLTLSLGFVKGLSSRADKGRGTINLDLLLGTYKVSLSELSAGTYEIGLLQNSPNGTSLGPDPQDWLVPLTVFSAGQNPFLTSEEPLELSGNLPGELKDEFRLDFVVVREISGQVPESVLFGSPKLFDKWYFGGLKADLPWASLVMFTAASPLDDLVAEGEALFLNETFAGNGRTCGTCHRPENNFTIDPAFIATLPPTDPLFVAETNPLLSQLEKPQLMRQFGLILENVDGLSDPTQKFVMRSVPHTFALSISMAQDATLVNPPADMLGWSGDGSAGNGSLREFAIGAVVQHATRSLNRIEGVDFRLPTETELDAMEAFQLSLGRQTDIDLAAVQFIDTVVRQGQSIFLNGNGNPNAQGRCQTCHAHAGANAAADGTNRNFNTGVESVVHPGQALENFPRDGGFGATPDGLGGFGNGRFNATSLIEAADTGPFFHNNLAPSIEDAVAFYSTDAFNATRAPTARILLTPSETKAVAAMLRVLNTLENIRQAKAYAERAINSINSQTILLALEECKDAISVLGPVATNPVARIQLEKARDSFVAASVETNPNQQINELQNGIKALEKSKEKLVVQ